MKEEATALCNNLKVWERGVKSEHDLMETAPRFRFSRAFQALA